MRIGLAVVGAALGAAAIYALLRAGQWMAAPDVDPALVVYSEHAGYFWRAWTAAYAGGSVGFVVWLSAGRAPLRMARLLAAATPLVAGLVAAQAILVP